MLLDGLNLKELTLDVLLIIFISTCSVLDVRIIKKMTSVRDQISQRIRLHEFGFSDSL